MQSELKSVVSELVLMLILAWRNIDLIKYCKGLGQKGIEG
jgi:hypothetical protein